jgi:hypothetical protein
MAGLIDAEPLSEGELRLGLPLEVRTDRLTVWRDLGADRLLQFVDAYRETVGGGVRVVYRSAGRQAGGLGARCSRGPRCVSCSPCPRQN